METTELRGAELEERRVRDRVATVDALRLVAHHRHRGGRGTPAASRFRTAVRPRSWKSRHDSEGGHLGLVGRGQLLRHDLAFLHGRELPVVELDHVAQERLVGPVLRPGQRGGQNGQDGDGQE